MSYLVDTNALSELRKRTPDRNVVAWFAERPASTLYVSVLTLAEIRRGIEQVADEKRRAALADWLEVDLRAFFTGRVLPVDTAVADRWGRLLAHAARPMPAVDSLIAATAIEHDLVLVTRNVRDFEGLPVQVLDPWSGGISVQEPRRPTAAGIASQARGEELRKEIPALEPADEFAAPSSKYQPLTRFLLSRPAHLAEVTMSLAELQSILGAPLPESAWTHRPWWGNQKNATTRPQARAWMAAGFAVAGVNQGRDGGWVRFRRVQ